MHSLLVHINLKIRCSYTFQKICLFSLQMFRGQKLESDVCCLQSFPPYFIKLCLFSLYILDYPQTKYSIRNYPSIFQHLALLLPNSQFLHIHHTHNGCDHTNGLAWPQGSHKTLAVSLSTE